MAETKNNAKKQAAKTKAGKQPRGQQLTFKNASELQAYIAKEAKKDHSEYRLVSKTKPSAPAQQQPDPETTPSEGVWGPKPSVKRQLTEHPATVRFKATETRQFILSNKEDLKAWNELQARMHPPDSPEVRLTTYESQFSPTLSSFVLHVAFAEIEYQQLI